MIARPNSYRLYGGLCGRSGADFEVVVRLVTLVTSVRVDALIDAFSVGGL